MRDRRLIIAAVVLLASVTLGFRTRDSRPHPAEPQFRVTEIARLRAHFDSVDTELRQADQGSLTPAQRQARLTLIGWLGEYRDAGSFPVNDLFPDRAMPYFRDSRGVLCAMAYLIERSGRGDLVDRVALTRNNAFIPELAGDLELRAWLDSVGFTAAEAARVQPAYGPPPPGADDASTRYTVATILVSGAGLTTFALNLTAPSRGSGWAGVAAGAAGLFAGVDGIDDNKGTSRLATVNLIVGGAALAAGLYRLTRSQSTRPPDMTARKRSFSLADLTIAPGAIPTSTSARLGVVLQARF